MLYTEEQKLELEQIIEVFQDYLENSPYLDLVWSDKVGYVLLKISTEHRHLEGESLVIDDGETLCQELFSEIVTDVLQYFGNDHCSKAVDSLEAEEIARKFQPYLDRLPQYKKIAEACYGIEKGCRNAE
ncbi:MAG: hypothetical protein HFH36_13865 [Lachnospiraceae bacterium]|nr:hypothetical protein [Lachnospiraceae bacterium]